jgi:hypothetical protein
VKHRCTIFDARVGLVRILEKACRGTLHRTSLFLHPVGSAAHVVHSGPFGVRSIVALFIMLRWARCGFQKKHTGTHYAILVFLHPVRSMGHVVHSGASSPRNIGALFFILGWDRYEFHKKHIRNVNQTCVLASDGICGSHSAFR